MKIGLIGYGKMGKAIEAIAQERGHEIVFKVNSQLSIEDVQLTDADVCIEFSRPDLALKHIKALLEARIPSVIGTTGWGKELERVTTWVKNTKGQLIHASNFSLGVNLFFKLNEYLATLMAPYKEYNVKVEEIHHTQKLDYPSGTAITLTEGIQQNNAAYTTWNTALNEVPNTTQNSIPIQAIRQENVPGTHLITYSSPVDQIKIEHIANNRTGFALGAIIAAEWIVNQKGIFTFRDILN